MKDLKKFITESFSVNEAKGNDDFISFLQISKVEILNDLTRVLNNKQNLRIETYNELKKLNGKFSNGFEFDLCKKLKCDETELACVLYSLLESSHIDMDGKINKKYRPLSSDDIAFIQGGAKGGDIDVFTQKMLKLLEETKSTYFDATQVFK